MEGVTKSDVFSEGYASRGSVPWEFGQGGHLEGLAVTRQVMGRRGLYCRAFEDDQGWVK